MIDSSHANIAHIDAVLANSEDPDQTAPTGAV